MSWEAMSAIGTFVTAFILAAASIAAIVQIKHLRAANQLTAFLEINRVLNSDEFQAAVAFVFKELPNRLRDGEFVKELTGTEPLDRRKHPEIWLGDFWDQLGALIHLGVLEAPLFLATNMYVCPVHWQKLLPVVEFVRRDDPRIWLEFENLAKLCDKYARKLSIGAPWTVRLKHPSAEQAAGR
jgi:hypothetical protein